MTTPETAGEPRGKYDCVVCGQNIPRDVTRFVDPQRHYTCDRKLGRMWMEARQQNDTLTARLREVEAERDAASAVCLEATLECETLRAQLAAATARADRLAALASEAAYDIETTVNTEYGAPDVHPAMQRKYERDMQIVKDIRAALAPAAEVDGE